MYTVDMLTVKEMAQMGGRARAKKLTPERRKEIAIKAARTRWDKKKQDAVRK